MKKGGVILEEITKRIKNTIKSPLALSEHLKISTAQISRWKNGTSEMGIYKLKAICEYYRVSADWILGIEKEEEEITIKVTKNEAKALKKALESALK